RKLRSDTLVDLSDDLHINLLWSRFLVFQQRHSEHAVFELGGNPRSVYSRSPRAFSKRSCMIAHERSTSSWLIFPSSQVLTASCILDSSPFVSNSSIVLPTSFKGMK